MTTYIHLHFSIFVCLTIMSAAIGTTGWVLGELYAKGKISAKKVFFTIAAMAVMSPFALAMFL